MLQNIRKSSQGTAARVIIGVIVVSFAAFGIESILLGSGSNGVAEVNGEEISPFEFEQVLNTQQRQLIDMMGGNIDPEMLESDRLRAQAMQTIINRKLLMQSADDMNLSISEAEIGTFIGGMEQFQIAGQFSPEMYRSLLANQGYTPATFKQGLVEDLILNQLRSGLAGSDFATPAELTLTATISSEQRDVRYMTLPLAQFRSDVEIGNEEIAAYYEERKEQFVTEESVELDYIELRVDDFREPVAEEALLEEFELVKSEYQYQTENRVSHILFEQGEDEVEADYQARIASAQTALDQGQEFSSVAGELSDDIGSAAGGGDLGFSAGDAFPEEMEAAIATLELNQVSEPVATDAGTHLILLTERRDGEEASIDDVRIELEESLQLSAARAEILRTVDDLRDLVFNAESLDAPAAELALNLSQSGALTRAGGAEVFANSVVLAAAFSEDVLELGHNSEVLEISNDHFIVVRVSQHNTPQTMPLEQVRTDIVIALTEESARAAVSAAADAALAALHSGQSVEAYALENGYEWQVELGADRRNSMVPSNLLRRVFEIPALDDANSSRFDYVASGSGDIQVFELSRVTKGNYEILADAEKTALNDLIAGEVGGLVQQQYQQDLRARAEISVL
ncbi:MAG: SurA N-terminal domain-containing protein [Halioglobus sp.]